jgi:hypothetical protein
MKAFQDDDDDSAWQPQRFVREETYRPETLQAFSKKNHLGIQEIDRALALELQREEEIAYRRLTPDPNEQLDRELALKLQREETHNELLLQQELLERQESITRCWQEQYKQEALARQQEQCKQEALARQLQEQIEQEELMQRQKVQAMSDREMATSHTGKAWKFVERVYQLHRTKSHLYGAEPVAVDDMVFLVENMLRAQQEFRDKGLPCAVDIGYHYTQDVNMPKIKTDGLLSRTERDANQIESGFNGEVYGPGIYTGNDPESFSVYGRVGLIVARLKGKELDPVSSSRGYEKGNTSIASGALVVLQKSCQCLALIQFPRNQGHDVMREYSLDLRLLLLEFFNDGESIPGPPALCKSSAARGFQNIFDRFRVSTGARRQHTQLGAA